MSIPISEFSKSIKTIYLAGPITGLSYEDASGGWRPEFAKLINDVGIKCVSPLRGKQYLGGIKSLDGGGGSEDAYAQTLLSSRKSIVTRDHFDVKRANLIVANFLGAKNVSKGTMVEYGWADAYRIPIVTIIEKDGSNIHEHGFVRELSGYIVDNIQDAAYIASTLLSDSL